MEIILFSSLQKLSIHRDRRAFRLRPYVTARPAMPISKKEQCSESQDYSYSINQHSSSHYLKSNQKMKMEIKKKIVIKKYVKTVWQ